jgi:hypothetical protein
MSCAAACGVAASMCACVRQPLALQRIRQHTSCVSASRWQQPGGASFSSCAGSLVAWLRARSMRENILPACVLQPGGAGVLG